MDYEVELSDALRSKSHIHLVVNEAGENVEYKGFVVGLSDQFAVMEIVSDWHLDGAMIVPRKHAVAAIRNPVYDDQKAILLWAGVQPTNQFRWLNLAGFIELFTSIEKAVDVVVVEDDQSLEVGTIKSISKDAVHMNVFDASGKWKEEPAEMPFEDIYRICVGDEYSQVLGNYVKQSKSTL